MSDTDVFHGRIKAQTEKAILFLPLEYLDDEEEAIWLPLSCCAIKERGDIDKIEIEVWLAEKKGLYA